MIGEIYVNEEEMKFMVKAATDSYFANMDINIKMSLMQDPNHYMNEYMKISDIAQKAYIENKKREEQMKNSQVYEESLGPIIK